MPQLTGIKALTKFRLLAGDEPVSANFTLDVSDAKPTWRKDEQNNSDSADAVGAGPTDARGT